MSQAYSLWDIELVVKSSTLRYLPSVCPQAFMHPGFGVETTPLRNAWVSLTEYVLLSFKLSKAWWCLTGVPLLQKGTSPCFKTLGQDNTGPHIP